MNLEANRVFNKYLELFGERPPLMLIQPVDDDQLIEVLERQIKLNKPYTGNYPKGALV